MFGNIKLEDEKFVEKEHKRLGFDNGILEHDREQMLFKPNRKLTTKNKQFLKAVNKINTHLTNIVEHSKQHCKFCKIMNTTQKAFLEKTFEQETFHYTKNRRSYEYELVPEHIIKMGKVMLCEEC